MDEAVTAYWLLHQWVAPVACGKCGGGTWKPLVVRPLHGQQQQLALRLQQQATAAMLARVLLNTMAPAATWIKVLDGRLVRRKQQP
jgi:hypothetical protein